MMHETWRPSLLSAASLAAFPQAHTQGIDEEAAPQLEQKVAVVESRDGAAARYGSDAIAGVINIVLKEGVEKGGASISAGTTAEGGGETLGSALRREPYSGFGNTTAGKLIARCDPSRAFGIRASASTGFRASSVQQKFYSSVSTNLNNAGVLTETLTAREGSAVTRAFGIAPLKDETSRSASIGMVLRPVSHFSVTADGYRTDIDDRIVFSSTVSPESGACPTPAACPIRAILDPLRVGQADRHRNPRPRRRRRAPRASCA